VSDNLNITPLDVSEWDPRLSGIVENMRGRPLNVHKLLANHPALLEAWWDFRNHAVGGGDLEQRHRELVILRVAVHMRSWYEWASHVERGAKAGITLDEIERVRCGELEHGWDERDALVLRATDECFLKLRISSATRNRMRGLFKSSELLDLIAIYGVYVILGTMINTWGLELDSFIDLPPEVSESDWLQG